MYLYLFTVYNPFSLLVLNIMLVLYAGSHTHFMIKFHHSPRKIINYYGGHRKKLGLNCPLSFLVGGYSLLVIFQYIHMLPNSH